MRASGNGDARVCASNLIRIFKGEVPYERVKGLSPQVIDAPALNTKAVIEEDVARQIQVYEPRCTLTNIILDHIGGNLSIAVEVDKKR